MYVAVQNSLFMFTYSAFTWFDRLAIGGHIVYIRKEKLGESHVKLSRKIRVVSGYNL